MNAKEIWESTWAQDVHASEFAEKRMKSARSSQQTPVQINREDCSGCFQGRHGHYVTFLDRCTCGDFIRNHRPCKHMYRLAAELGVIALDCKNDSKAIVEPMESRVPLHDVIDRVEALSESAQKQLLSIVRKVSAKQPRKRAYYRDCIELIDSGLLVDGAPNEHTIKLDASKDELIAFLESQGESVSGKENKPAIIDRCMKYPDALVQAGYFYFYASIPVQLSSTLIHYYLHRKLDIGLYEDNAGNMFELSPLETNLPYDAATDELIQRGYYVRKEHYPALSLVQGCSHID